MPELERVTIDGKSGTMADFDAKHQLTTADKAVTVKVVFDDGDRLFLAMGDKEPGATSESRPSAGVKQSEPPGI